jgi:hypothetical protein
MMQEVELYDINHRLPFFAGLNYVTSEKLTAISEIMNSCYAVDFFNCSCVTRTTSVD